MRSTYSNRGMLLETYLFQANHFYKLREKARIDKEATPVKVLQTKGNAIVKAHYERKGTVDYKGVYKGRSIAFDAKETKSKTSFPLVNNVEDHQFEYLTDHHKHGGISFLIILFQAHQETYILTFDDLQYWWQESQNGGRKSIPYEFFQKRCNLVKPGGNITLNYLDALDL